MIFGLHFSYKKNNHTKSSRLHFLEQNSLKDPLKAAIDLLSRPCPGESKEHGEEKPPISRKSFKKIVDFSKSNLKN